MSNTPPVQRPGRRGSRWALAGLTFAVGLVVGVLAVGLLSSGKPDFPTTGSPVPSSAGTGEPTSPAAGASAVARVNPACLQVINEAQQISNILSGVGDAASDVDLQRLDDIVRELQPVEPRLQRDLKACDVSADVGSGPESQPPPAPVPTASPS